MSAKVDVSLAPQRRIDRTRPHKLLEALKTTTRRADIGASIPVFGFRPTRSRLDRTTKAPKLESLTFSLRLNASIISANVIATSWWASSLETPTRSYTAAASSALVTAFGPEEIKLGVIDNLDKCLAPKDAVDSRGASRAISA
jgi:hypothetical protein